MKKLSISGNNQMNTEIQEKVDLIIELLIERFKVQAIYLFGSSVKQELRADSDIDLAFLSDHDFAAYDLFSVASEISELLKREVDLIDLRVVSTVFQMQVVSTGCLIYARQQAIAERFEMMVYKAYAMLNDERQEVLKYIREEGAAYDR